MKKTLVAIAALAVVGAASAQSNVTITGNYGFAYVNSHSAAKVNSSGFETTDGKVVFKASEDLGAGLKAGVSMDLRLRGRGAQASVVNGRDASISLSGGFGTVKMGSVNTLGPNHLDLATPGVIDGLDYDVAGTMGAADTSTNVDMVSYTSPDMSGFTVGLMIADSIGGPTSGGLQSGAATASATQLNLAYSNGPINVGFDYIAFNKNASATADDNRWHLAGNYNFGVATVGLGFSRNNASTAGVGTVRNESALGVAVPMGAATFGLSWGRSSTSVGGAASLDKSGWELGVNYALSKRTSVDVAYLSGNTAIAGDDRETKFRTRLIHSF